MKIPLTYTSLEFFRSSLPTPNLIRYGSIKNLLLISFVILFSTSAKSFTFENVSQKAKRLAEKNYQSRTNESIKELNQLDYDAYRDIRFRQDKAYWRDAKLPFELAFFHMGRYFNTPVLINEVNENRVSEIKYDPLSFDFGKNKIDSAKLKGLGFAGFRVHYPLNTPEYKDELIVFLGASYFRALGKNQVYGLSGRGLAINTATSKGEEFPAFVEFWVQRPHPNAKELTIYGLLDSPSLTGAYQFIVRPGVQTHIDVKTRLFARSAIEKLGIAPLTSMYLFGENQKPNSEDYRPEVHDSDGLSIQAGTGDWIWRPLVNPKQLLLTSFVSNNPRGFGLMQRDHSFIHYEDLEAHYEKRPSAWIQPKGKWGNGRIELVQIPVPDETNDNIVAYWIPEKPIKPRSAYNIEYRMSWQLNPEAEPPTAKVVQTRRGHGYLQKPDDSIHFLIDFVGPSLKNVPQNVSPGVVASADGNGQILEKHVYPNPTTGGWRFALKVRRIDDTKPTELRAHLQQGTKIISETWSYILPPN